MRSTSSERTRPIYGQLEPIGRSSKAQVGAQPAGLEIRFRKDRHFSVISFASVSAANCS
jgi:hypothetical protein